MATATTDKLTGKIATRAEWLAARRELLRKEKELTRLRDELSRQRRELPWLPVRPIPIGPVLHRPSPRAQQLAGIESQGEWL